MMHKLMKYLDNKIGFEEARAHCDIPCGIYDPITAEIAALTVIRMMDLMKAQEEKGGNMDLGYFNTMSRYIAAKEEHAEKVKSEIRIIWGDYLKPEHARKFPELHNLVHEIMKLGSAVRQGVDMESAESLLEHVNRFSEIFWETKGIKTWRVMSPYQPERIMVQPDLPSMGKEALKKAS